MTMTERDIRALSAEVDSEMPGSVTLVFVDYRDEFNRDQIDQLVRGDIDSLSESVWEWESDVQWNSACDYVDEIARDVIGRWEREDGTDYEDLRNEWQISDERDSALDTIRERDNSDVLAGLARNSGNVLLRMPIDGLDEDHSMDEMDLSEFLSRIGFAETERNLEYAAEIMGETEYPGAVRMGYVLAAVSVSDVYSLPFDTDARVTIKNPHIYFGNPFAGTGWSAGPFEGELEFRRGELRSDHDAFGYGWEEITGGVVVSNYESEIAVVTESENGNA